MSQFTLENFDEGGRAVVTPDFGEDLLEDVSVILKRKEQFENYIILFAIQREVTNLDGEQMVIPVLHVFDVLFSVLGPVSVTVISDEQLSSRLQPFLPSKVTL